MRASRLVSVLLLLQARHRMTARQIADELEVSVRTVYRDMESLQAAGVPLYADAGHAGGYRLVEGYRTRLTGLHADEAEALFLAGVPGPAAELGLGSVLAAAQRKLRAALPAGMREQADRIQRLFHLDAPGWYHRGDDVPFLPAVAGAVFDRRVIEVRYRRWRQPEEVDRRLEPCGLVLKAGRWYLVARSGGAPRTYRVDQILRLAVLDETCEPPGDDFDLAEYWRRYLEDFHARLHRGEALIRVAPDAVGRLDGAAGAAVREHGEAEADGGWIRARVPIESTEHAHARFLALGAEVEVLEPAELRAAVGRTARELAARYGCG